MPTCFVIMGFGKKTDYQSTPPRTLDLDKSYHNVIKPAVESAGVECIRADEIVHAGVIDVPMYEHLLNADLVIADLSTYNPNAFYELGVRHALRPFTTIVIAEDQLRYPFDVNHTTIRSYRHLGEDIGYSDAVEFQGNLKAAIAEILSAENVDSPVYTYLSALTPPRLGEQGPGPDAGPEPDPGPDVHEATVATLLTQVDSAKSDKDFATARGLLEAAATLRPHDDYLKQQLALATYKAAEKRNDETTVPEILKARAVLLELDPRASADPETLGLWGAVHKRLWERTDDRAHIDEAIDALERGFLLKQDYYNGINLAFMLDVRASVSTGDDQTADRVLARRTRNRVIEICLRLVEAAEQAGGSVDYWIAATLEEAFHALGNQDREAEWRDRAESLSSESWCRDSTVEQLKKLDSLMQTR